MDSSLTIIDVARVTPSNSDSSESLSLSLTFYDLLWMKLHAVERVIFYRLNEATRSYFVSVIVPQLKTSLSLTLSHYLPLAGRLVWDSEEHKPSIVYSPNDAVFFTIAETNADFFRLSGNERFSTTELYSLVPELRISDDSASALSLQVTLFPNQGFSISVTAHHAVLDGKTTIMFLKSWAHICKHQQQQDHSAKPLLPQDLIPYFDRTVIKGPPGIDTQILNAVHSLTKLFTGGKEPENPKSLKLLPTSEISPDAVRFTLELTQEHIQILRERIKKDSPKNIRLSTFVITYSYAFTCLIKARGGDPNRPVGYGFAVDCRTLVNPQIPMNYFGNCVSAAAKSRLTAGMFMGEEGFVTAARFVSDSIEELDEKVAWKIPELFEVYRNNPIGSQVLSVAGSTRFGVYGLDFGWGKPLRVVIVSIDKGEAISMAEGRKRNGGVEIGFAVKKHEMDVLVDLLQNGLKKL